MSDDEKKALPDPGNELAEPRDSAAAENAAKRACRVVEEIGNQIVSQFGADLNRRERLRVVAVLRAKLIPHRRRGRPRKENVTAALADLNAGINGIELFRRHIPNWSRHNRWRRECEARALLNAIRARKRRERKIGQPRAGSAHESD